MFRKISYWLGFTVMRWQLIATLLCVWAIYGFTDEHFKIYDNSDQSLLILHAFLPVLARALLLVLGFSVLTSLCSYLWFIFRYRSKKVSVTLKFGDGQQALAGMVPYRLTVKGIFRPLLGTVRGKLVFTGMKLSSPVLLDENNFPKGSILRQSISGKGETMLHDRGIYDVEEIHLQFFDALRIIMLPFSIHVSNQFYTLPQKQEEKLIKANPNTTEEQLQRIEIPKRVEGEYLNYKDFETGDDVRRIVWKIYARSKELVVRIPETMDPYASHLYFYASFFRADRDVSEEVFETELLNGYKDRLRNILDSLQLNGFEVRMPHDQETPKLAGVGDKKNDLFHITAAHWQKDKRPVEFVEPRKAAFVCVSSLVPAQDVARAMDNLPMYVPVVAIKLSDGIPSVFRFRFKNIFFKPEPQPADSLRSRWLLSPMRARLKKNERELQSLFNRRGNAFLIDVNGK
ncbi:MAG: DUF58 domain-containing protein [Bacteroidetes bacterium]|nr:DUF58 domain-containing protein [Bacteroidota bacterium]